MPPVPAAPQGCPMHHGPCMPQAAHLCLVRWPVEAQRRRGENIRSHWMTHAQNPLRGVPSSAHAHAAADASAMLGDPGLL